MKTMRSRTRGWVGALLIALPLGLVWAIAARRSWMPRVLHDVPPAFNGYTASVRWLSKDTVVGNVLLIPRLKADFYESRSQLQFWNTLTRTKPVFLELTPDDTFALSADGRQLAVTQAFTKFSAVEWENESRIQLRDAQSGQALFVLNRRTPRAMTAPIFGETSRRLAFSPDGSRLYHARGAFKPNKWGQADSNNPFLLVEVWNLKTHRLERAHDAGAVDARILEDGFAFDLSPQGQWLSIPDLTDHGYRIGLLNTSTWKRHFLRLTKNADEAVPQHMTFSRDGATIAVRRSVREIEIYDTTSGNRRGRVALPQLPAGQIGKTLDQFALSDEGQWLATVSSDSATTVWDARNGQAVRTPGRLRNGSNYDDPLTGMARLTHRLAFSPDASRLAVADSNGTVTLWRVK